MAERLPGAASPSITIEPSSEGDIDAITELYAAENATRSCTVDRPREMIAEQMASFLSPEQPLEGARFVTTTDEESARVGRLLGISDDGLIASVSFFGEDPDGPADVASDEDDSEETHDSEMPQYTAEVAVGSLTRWSWGSDWASVKEGGQTIGYFCWSKNTARPWGGGRAGVINWHAVDVHGWQADDIGREAADADQLQAAALELSEIAAPARAFPSIAGFLASQASDGTRVAASLPPDHPFSRYLKSAGAFEHATHPWSESTMVRIVGACKAAQRSCQFSRI